MAKHKKVVWGVVSYMRPALRRIKIGLYMQGARRTVAQERQQEETKHTDHPWHIYSVPKRLEICAVLAVIKYVLTHPHILNRESPFFMDQANRNA